MFVTLEQEQVPLNIPPIDKFIDWLYKDTPRTIPGDGFAYVGPSGKCKQSDIALLMNWGNHINPKSEPKMFIKLRAGKR